MSLRWPICLTVLCALGCASWRGPGRSPGGPGAAPPISADQRPGATGRAHQIPGSTAPRADVHPNVQPGPRVPVKLGPPRRAPGPRPIPRGVPVAGMQSAAPPGSANLAVQWPRGFSPVRLQPLIETESAEDDLRPDGVRGYVQMLPPPPELEGVPQQALSESRYFELPPPPEL